MKIDKSLYCRSSKFRHVCIIIALLQGHLLLVRTLERQQWPLDRQEISQMMITAYRSECCLCLQLLLCYLLCIHIYYIVISQYKPYQYWDRPTWSYLIYTLLGQMVWTHYMFVVYFHQISFTMKDNKINGCNRNKTMKKFERKNCTH